MADKTRAANFGGDAKNTILRGSTPAVTAENTRTMKAAGMSERDAVMASLKRTTQERKAEKGPSNVQLSSREDYPYGTRLELGHEELAKLGLKGVPAVGKKFAIQGHAHVHSSSQRQDGDGTTSRNVSLQITHMKLGAK